MVVDCALVKAVCGESKCKKIYGFLLGDKHWLYPISPKYKLVPGFWWQICDHKQHKSTGKRKKHFPSLSCSPLSLRLSSSTCYTEWHTLIVTNHLHCTCTSFEKISQYSLCLVWMTCWKVYLNKMRSLYLYTQDGTSPTGTDETYCSKCLMLP